MNITLREGVAAQHTLSQAEKTAKELEKENKRDTSWDPPVLEEGSCYALRRNVKAAILWLPFFQGYPVSSHYSLGISLLRIYPKKICNSWKGCSLNKPSSFLFVY